MAEDVLFDEHGNEVESLPKKLFTPPTEDEDEREYNVEISMRATSVMVKTVFQAFHRWVNAPERMKFLREYHRHLFYVRLCIRVPVEDGKNINLDREIEFLEVKDKLDVFCTANFLGKYLDLSCEMIAEKIVIHMLSLGYETSLIEVTEDNENGSITLPVYTYTPVKTLVEFNTKEK